MNIIIVSEVYNLVLYATTMLLVCYIKLKNEIENRKQKNTIKMSFTSLVKKKYINLLQISSIFDKSNL